jgi:hypothetical protein
MLRQLGFLHPNHGTNRATLNVFPSRKNTQKYSKTMSDIKNRDKFKTVPDFSFSPLMPDNLSKYSPLLKFEAFTISKLLQFVLVSEKLGAL